MQTNGAASARLLELAFNETEFLMGMSSTPSSLTTSSSNCATIGTGREKKNLIGVFNRQRGIDIYTSLSKYEHTSFEMRCPHPSYLTTKTPEIDFVTDVSSSLLANRKWRMSLLVRNASSP